MSIFFAKLRALDWMLLAALGGIVLFGATALYSIGLGRDGALYLERQLSALAVGVVGMLFLSLLNFRVLKNASIPLYIGTCLLLIIVLFFGEKVRGTRGWFYIGTLGFQPAELAKLALVIGLARYFDVWTRRIGRIRPILVSGMIAAVPVGLILLQPDFGSAIIVFSIWLAMILMSGIPKRYSMTLGILFIVVVTSAWMFLFQDYQKDRVRSFLFPQTNSQGAGYNVRQARIAIGGGQLTGTGIGAGSGSQLRFLPEAQTDFIFAVIAEELGFVGVAALLLFWLLFFYRCITILRRAQDDFSAFIVLGCTVVFFTHVAINIGGNLGLIPITGLVLPFVSYGGSALVMFLLMVGLVQSVRIHSAN